MLIYLYGPDLYRRRKKLKEYIGRYKAKYPAFSLSYFYLDKEDEWEKLKDFCRAVSLFESSKLGVIYKANFLEEKQRKDFIKILKENLESKDLTLIISEDKGLNKSFSFLLDKPAISHFFEDLKGAELLEFLNNEAKKRSLNLDKGAKEMLADVFGGNSWGLATELDKLALLNEKEINKDILEKHTEISLPIDIFSAFSRMENSDAGRRLFLLDELLMKSGDPAMIFNMMSVFAKTAADKKKMADYDATVKMGKLEYEEILLEIALKP